jgi:uncharacterized protein YggT (Ycf19 family)
LILRGMRAALSSPLFAMLRLQRRSPALGVIDVSPSGAVVADVSARLRC